MNCNNIDIIAVSATCRETEKCLVSVLALEDGLKTVTFHKSPVNGKQIATLQDFSAWANEYIISSHVNLSFTALETSSELSGGTEHQRQHRLSSAALSCHYSRFALS